MLSEWSAFFVHRTSVYDSRARERLRQIEEQKALALKLQNQVKKVFCDTNEEHIQVETNFGRLPEFGIKAVELQDSMVAQPCCAVFLVWPASPTQCT